MHRFFHIFLQKVDLGNSAAKSGGFPGIVTKTAQAEARPDGEKSFPPPAETAKKKEKLF